VSQLRRISNEDMQQRGPSMADRRKKRSTTAKVTPDTSGQPAAQSVGSGVPRATPPSGNSLAQPTAANAVIRTMCVYCGSGPGVNPAYAKAADILGRSMAQANIGLVYGGGGLGLMGQTAKSVLAHGGNVTGIIPQFLSDKERMLRDVQELIVTEDMHQRKKLMFERSDAFVALPGGIGTLEELVEQLTWAQLGRHTKPIVLANIDRFWEPMLALLAHMRSEAFIRAGLEVRFVTVDRAEDIVPAAIAAASPAGMNDPRLKALTKHF
jgi:uncharacterized protein (TIGR00730 family)